MAMQHQRVVSRMSVLECRRLSRNLIALSIGLLLACSFAFVPARAAGLNLSAYKGKVVYLDFWASWCTPCLRSFPWMNDLADSYKGRGLVVVAVNVDHNRNLADTFLQQHPADFHVVYDPGGSLADKFDVEAMPTSFLIGRDGKIHYVHAGFHPGHIREYLSQIRALLKQKAS
jgi:thiol-disulfide isomerase/thioredoxin